MQIDSLKREKSLIGKKLIKQTVNRNFILKTTENKIASKLFLKYKNYLYFRLIFLFISKCMFIYGKKHGCFFILIFKIFLNLFYLLNNLYF